MKKLLLTTGISILISSLSIAQESVGFSEPDDISPLLDYRLPDWGFTNLFWDFSMNGNLQKRQSDSRPESSSLDRFSGQLAPVYFRYRESEPRISSYIIRPDFDFSIRESKTFGNEEFSERDAVLSLNWDFNEKFYLKESNLYFTGIFSGEFLEINSHEKSKIQSTTVADVSSLTRTFTPTLSAGIGYGRLRNVNPMIRAIRMNERLGVLNPGFGLSETDLFRAAEQFTQINGYAQIYDRPQKYFWGDMDEVLSADLSALDPFDLLYLTDTLQESIGSRSEGWQIEATAGLRYQVIYDSTEDETAGGTAQSNLSRSTLFTPNLSGVWAKNLSLRHQLRMNSSVHHLRDLRGDERLKMTTLNASANWLYSISDRILANTGVNYIRNSRELFSNSVYMARTEFNYFLENRVSLFGNLSFIYEPESVVTITGGEVTETIDQRSINFNAGVRYYMRRGLY